MAKGPAPPKADFIVPATRGWTVHDADTDDEHQVIGWWATDDGTDGGPLIALADGQVVRASAELVGPITVRYQPGPGG